MAQINLDLTGRNGLAPKYFGDLGTQTPAHELRTIAQDGQMVDGIYNPSRFLGYFSPANKSTVPVTTSESASIIGSTLYNSIEHQGYFAERNNRIFVSDGLNDLNLSKLLEITRNISEDVKITDLEIYQLNNQRRLFYSYIRDDSESNGEITGDIGVYNLEDVNVLEFTQGSRYLKTDTTQYFFGQKIIGLHRFDRVKVYLRFFGTNNSFNLKCVIRDNGRQTNEQSGTIGNEFTTKVPGEILYTSELVAASSLSTTDFAEVVFTFDEVVDIQRERNDSNEFDYEDSSGFWIFIEPEVLGSFTTPDNDFAISVVDVDDIDFTLDNNSEVVTDMFLSVGITHPTYTYLGQDASITTYNTLIDNTIAAADGRVQIISYLVTTEDNLPTRGDIHMTIDFSQSASPGDGGVSLTIRKNSPTDPGNNHGWNDEEITINLSNVPGGTPTYTNITYTQMTNILANVTGNFSNMIIEFIIHKSLEDSDTVDVWWDESVGGTATINSADIEYFDRSATKKMSLGLIQPTQEDKWLSLLTDNNFFTQGSETKTVNADNGFMYILDKNLVHQLDGSNIGSTYGNVTQEVLRFPAFFDIVDGLDSNSNIFLAINQRPKDDSSNGADSFTGECGVYIWDRLSTQVRMRDYIQIIGAKEIKKIYMAPSGDVRLITVSANGITEIRSYSRNTFEVMQEVGYDSFPAFADSLSKVGNMVYWLGSDGRFYGHGMIEGGDREGLFVLNNLEDSQQTGAILYGGGRNVTNAARDAFYLSYILEQN